jgi:AhpD family alkylhydroperoxidase
MLNDWNQLTKDLTGAMTELRGGMPDVMQTFSAMAKAATAKGALDPKTKELIAMAIAVATRCDGCIGFHAKAASRLGASRDEVMETMAMAVYMGAGPSVMYAASAVEAFDQFAAAKAPA